MTGMAAPLTDEHLRAIRKELPVAHPGQCCLRGYCAATLHGLDKEQADHMHEVVAPLLAEVERLRKGVAVAREAAEQPTDYDEDTEAEIALGHRILAAAGETGPRTLDGPIEDHVVYLLWHCSKLSPDDEELHGVYATERAAQLAAAVATRKRESYWRIAEWVDGVAVEQVRGDPGWLDVHNYWRIDPAPVEGEADAAKNGETE